MTVATARVRLTDQMNVPEGSSRSLTGDEARARFNAFVAAGSRHACAAEMTLFECTRRQLDQARADALRGAVHSFMMSLRAMHARLSGSAQLMNVPWVAILNEVCLHLDVLLNLEEEVVAQLSEVLPDHEVDFLAEELSSAERDAPTRPHPHLPRRGVAGRMARKAACKADAFWDSVQGRILASPDGETASSGVA